jgi:oligopeptide transport system permease protein
VPLGEVVGGNKVSFEDTASLEVKTYYYTVTAKNLAGDESIDPQTVEVKPERAISPSDAAEYKADAKAGDVVTLPSVPFGTDSLGRDMLARLMMGGKVSLFIGFFASLVYVFIGVIIGGLSGFLGGRFDAWVVRVIDFINGLPFLLFMILLKVMLSVGPGESGIGAMMIALVALSWTGPARLVRGQILQLREAEFVQAARLLGARPGYLIARHLIPNLIGVILVALTFGIPSTIFTEAFLSFIGLGVASPATSWGAMCTDGVQTLLSKPHEFFFPAIFISLTVLAFNILGDGLRDALDPRMRSTT